MVDLADVEQAYDQIKQYVNKTPVMTSRTLNKMVGGEVFLKCENFSSVSLLNCELTGNGGIPNGLVPVHAVLPHAGVHNVNRSEFFRSAKRAPARIRWPVLAALLQHKAGNLDHRSHNQNHI